MKQYCTTESKSTVWQNRWQIHDFYQDPGQLVTSEQFVSDCYVFWHYVLQTEPNFWKITAVIDSCNAELEVKVELVPQMISRNNVGTYKMAGKARSGSKIGEISIHKSQFIDFCVLETDILILTLNFAIVKEPFLPESELWKHMSSLLSNEQLSDVTILVGQRKFYALKAILSVRSPVFAAMFQSGMQESALNRIVIEDIEPEVFEEVLRFIYTGQVYGLGRITNELLAAADKYALDALKQICSGYIGAEITQETVLKTLQLADLYHDTILKERAIRFVCENIKTMQSTNWNAFVHSHPDLLAAIVGAMAMQ